MSKTFRSFGGYRPSPEGDENNILFDIAVEYTDTCPEGHAHGAIFRRYINKPYTIELYRMHNSIA
jgi:hypothetical protein